MQVQVVFIPRDRLCSAVPGARVDEEPVFEKHEVRVAGVAMPNSKSVYLPPALQILAAEDNDRSRWMHHVPVRTTAERQVVMIAITGQIGERVVFSVVKHTTNIANSNGGRISAAGD